MDKVRVHVQRIANIRMAKHPSAQPPQAPRLSLEQMRTAIVRFRRRIEDLQKFDPRTVKDRFDPSIRVLEVAIEEALSDSFGHDAREYRRYSAAANLDTAALIVGERTPLHEIIEGLEKGKQRSLALLQQAIRSLEEKIAGLIESEKVTETGETTIVSPPSGEVFIVHGRDEQAKTEVARFLERAGLEAVILHEQPNAGHTILEKFEDCGESAGFAVVVLTPDDVGGPNPTELQPRARQNVIGEMFWFAGKLGRRRVCALKKGNLELPSDITGLGFTEMDGPGAWKQALLRELQAAGYKFDWQKALS